MKPIKSIQITFDNSAKDQILDLFNKSVDEDGYIVETSNPTQRVLNVEGQEVTLSDFGGIRRGSEIFINSDISSVRDLSKK